VLLDLHVAEFKYLKTVWVCALGGLSLCEVIHYLLIGECLFDVTVVEVHNGVSIWECLPPDSIAEYDLLLSIEIGPLDLAIIALDTLLDRGIIRVVIVVLVRHIHLIVIILGILMGVLLYLNILDFLHFFFILNLLLLLLLVIGHHILNLLFIVFELHQG
jgi:hypothetical protein